MEPFSETAKSAQGFARSPLGIIALFIVLVHGFASLVVALSGNLGEAERWPIIIFLVTFPVLVLFAFCWLVAKHHQKLYGPMDFREDSSFLQYTERVKAAVALGRASAAPKTAPATPAGAEPGVSATAPTTPSDDRSIEVISAEVAAALDPRESWSGVKGRVVLWVDDRPQNNTNEADALRAAGMVVVNVTNTDDAIRQLKDSRFSVVISDMTRGLDREAGYELLDKMKEEGLKVPVIIYAGPAGEEDKRKARARGAVARVNSASQLFRLVIGEARNSPA